MEAMREIELKGHIIDSFLLPKVFDKVMDMNGEFEILEFEIGKHKTDTSYARLMIKGRDQEHLDDIIGELHRLGAYLPEAEDAIVEEAPKDRVVPKGFYSTTNHTTYVKVDGEWRRVKDQKMDALIVIKDNEAVCTTLGHIKKGDRVVVGNKGIRVVPPERPRGHTIFDFMGSQVSSERPSQALIREIAEEIYEAKESGGKIVVVGGPAIVHTGGQQALAELIRKGYVDALLSGNALAVHDIEYNLYGTSLGMDLKTGELAPEGHKHHIYAISEITRAGSIREAVEKGILTGGIMYECIKNGVPYVLAGSIRDDGPLPDVITDTMKAQDLMREQVKDADIVLMLATMLHSIATGNCLASHVRTICVDINPATVTKLMDRGTAQAIGIVTDVGTFLPWLAEELDALEKARKQEAPTLKAKGKKHKRKTAR
ncbi:TIGR00300 family protein [Methanocella conradii HZ254]|uniref:Ornithine cyclodeaminase n=1 Tax=Methanocella conradii (strain DSM 24694 / JCM 17849 / CGMCC 1.5162 / HZ254) TaxID=1041930 RepID=H8I6B4_METCZ|nr:TIGR00300 family protein [Methanocella conradii]AFD01112.1 TIGR00300 family protein [Methanocella conradii HZ254]MDI6897051.1 TIGR00300 family protein [Methanocella conradii]